MTQFSIENVLNNFNNVTNKPEKFLSSPNELIKNIQNLIKQTYDFTKKEETINNDDTLPELIIENFDLEQIWQQVELQNNTLLENSIGVVSKLVAGKDRLWFTNDEENEESDMEEESPTNNEECDEENELELEEDELEENSEEEEEGNSETRIKSGKSSIVDDNFFKLDEMEQFLRKSEQESNNKTESNSEDEESIDLFEETNLDEDEEDDEEEDDLKNNPKYKDFFEPSEKNNKKRKRLLDDEDEDEVENHSDLKSTYDLREERLKKKITELEESALVEKPWQLKGEIRAEDRPQNSLLEEFVEFDLTTRPAPIITEETTLRLEDVIRQRIKDKAWDDVERKMKSVETPTEYRKKLLLDQEKGKKSLAQIYEDEYTKQKEALDPDAADKDEPEPKEHLEVREMMKSLFMKLDALSNFHFTPKSVAPEARIVSNLPAINMEEVAPVAVSDAALLAPEEVQKKLKGDLIGRDERSETDMKRERRQKKRKQGIHAVERNKQDKLGLGNKYSKEKAARLLLQVTKEKNVDKMDESIGNKAVKSSTSFFTQLQDEVHSQIKSKSIQKKKIVKQKFNAKKLKM